MGAAAMPSKKPVKMGSLQTVPGGQCNAERINTKMRYHVAAAPTTNAVTHRLVNAVRRVLTSSP